MAAVIGEGVAQAVGMGARQTAREILRVEEVVPDPETLVALGDWAPRIPTSTVAELVDGQGLLARGTTDQVREEIGRSLARSILLGEGLDSAAARLSQVLDGQAWRLRRLARTEINNAANVGHEASLAQAANRFPALALKKKWSAARDKRTSATCQALHGQVRETDQAFEGPGFSGMHPPAHPNCRSRVLPWADRWAEAPALEGPAGGGALPPPHGAFPEPPPALLQGRAELARQLHPAIRDAFEEARRGGAPVLSDTTVAQVRELIRQAEFDPELYVEGVTTQEFHWRKRALEQRQWPEASTPESYLADLRSLADSEGIRIGFGYAGGGSLLLDVPTPLAGFGGLNRANWTRLAFNLDDGSPGNGFLKTGYMVNDDRHQAGGGGGARWLN